MTHPWHKKRPGLFQMAPTYSKVGTYQVVISNRTCDDARAIELRRHIIDRHGISVFQQQTDRFAKDSCDWQVRY